MKLTDFLYKNVSRPRKFEINGQKLFEKSRPKIICKITIKKYLKNTMVEKIATIPHLSHITLRGRSLITLRKKNEILDPPPPCYKFTRKKFFLCLTCYKISDPPPPKKRT